MIVHHIFVIIGWKSIAIEVYCTCIYQADSSSMDGAKKCNVKVGCLTQNLSTNFVTKWNIPVSDNIFWGQDIILSTMNQFGYFH